MTTLEYQKDIANDYEIGIDEAGRGPMFGRLYVAAVILPKETEFSHKGIKDSKKIKSAKKMQECYEYITKNASAYSIQFIEHDIIDQINIRQAVLQAMHACIRDIYNRFPDIPLKKGMLLVDGNDFIPFTHFYEETETLISPPYETVEGGDNTYISIAAASILAKYSRDKYIEELCKLHPELATRYGINTNMGYGTKTHLAGIVEHGITQWHRKSYGSCKTAIYSPVS